MPKRDGKEERKDGRKEDKRKGEKKHKIKLKKSKHEIHPPQAEVIEKPVFGVPLSVSLERSRSHDGIQLPAIFRECVDYIEEHGLRCEGIYRISGVKSKVQHLKDQYNRGEEVYLEEHEPNIVAGVLKQFLRELPEPVLTTALIPKFEEASTIRNERRRIESFLHLIGELPECNRLLLSWMIVHMTHVIERQKENKMSLQNVSIVLSPTMQISHRVLNVLFSHNKHLFKSTVIKRYVPPLKPATSRWSLELPDNPQALAEELSKQESLLDQLHAELAAGTGDPEKEEQIWEVQRVCTQLKRKIKNAQKGQDTLEKRKRERDEQSKRDTVVEEGEEELKLELQELPEGEVLKLELRTPPPDAFQPPPVEGTESLGSQVSLEKGQEGIETQQVAAETQNVSVEVHTEENTEQKDTQEEASELKTRESTSQEKVTLKELASQSKTAKKSDAKAEKAETEKEVTEATLEVVDTEAALKETGEVDDMEKADKKVEDDEEGDKTNDEEDVVREIDVKADLARKHALALQEDSATDSELGQSRESVNQVESLSDEFEQSLEEILERDLDLAEHMAEHPDLPSDLPSELTETAEREEKTELEETADTPEDDSALGKEAKTPVPVETPESPPESPVMTAVDVTAAPEVAKEISEVKDEEEEEEEVAALEEREGADVVDTQPTPVPQINEESDEEPSTMPCAADVENAVELELSEMSEDESISEEQYHALLEEEYALKLEEEELLAIERELRKKIETEQCEAETLQQEIDELHDMRQDSDEEFLSSSSDSSYESEDEEDLQEILDQLIRHNEALERENSEMCSNIHKERMICLAVKVQIGMIQQKQGRGSARNAATQEQDSLIEFD
ncbi:ralA-binding protein 1-like isoform X2 [Mya arenaria]|uniref:ralA-binding protein 1-like isoform X2 n=1 Tax=Mya arenaria TaxID=6604 RepID=UPI0022E1B190|nr:ralA-binding protein 1-like isoform X2 [Mya arenaria]